MKWKSLFKKPGKDYNLLEETTLVLLDWTYLCIPKEKDY